MRIPCQCRITRPVSCASGSPGSTTGTSSKAQHLTVRRKTRMVIDRRCRSAITTARCETCTPLPPFGHNLFLISTSFSRFSLVGGNRSLLAYRTILAANQSFGRHLTVKSEPVNQGSHAKNPQCPHIRRVKLGGHGEHEEP